MNYKVVTNRISLRLWMIFLFLIIVNIAVAISSATSGSELLAMEKKAKVLAEENKKVMEMLVADQSLQMVSQKADEMGMAKPQTVVYLTVPSALAAR